MSTRKWKCGVNGLGFAILWEGISKHVMIDLSKNGGVRIFHEASAESKHWKGVKELDNVLCTR